MLQPPPPGCSTRCAAHAIKLAGSRPPRPAPSEPRPQAGRTVHEKCGSAPRRGKDRLLLKYSSNKAVNAPPVRKECCFKEETEVTFRLFFKNAPFLNWRRGRESNPRTLTGYVYSRHARSATTRPLQSLITITDTIIAKNTKKVT